MKFRFNFCVMVTRNNRSSVSDLDGYILRFVHFRDEKRHKTRCFPKSLVLHKHLLMRYVVNVFIFTDEIIGAVLCTLPSIAMLWIYLGPL